jgi:hypothetical protein
MGRLLVGVPLITGWVEHLLASEWPDVCCRERQTTRSFPKRPQSELSILRILTG